MTAEKGLEDIALQAARFTGDIGKAAIKNGLDEVAQQTAKYLAELTISGEEICRGAIRELERNDRDRVYFHNFMDLYEHELKELRTQKTRLTTPATTPAYDPHRQRSKTHPAIYPARPSTSPTAAT